MHDFTRGDLDFIIIDIVTFSFYDYFFLARIISELRQSNNRWGCYFFRASYWNCIKLNWYEIFYRVFRWWFPPEIVLNSKNIWIIIYLLNSSLINFQIVYAISTNQFTTLYLHSIDFHSIDLCNCSERLLQVILVISNPNSFPSAP